VRMLGPDDVDVDAIEARTSASPEDRVLSLERTAQTAEALKRLKPHEAQAMWLKAAGHSYAEISDATGWSATKVNRCLAEGRRSFLVRFAGIESGAECERWQPLISAMVDGEATAEQLIDLRPHLRNCAGCRAVARGLHESTSALRAVFPVGAIAMAASADPEPAGGLFVRAYEALCMALQERTAHTIVRLQSVMEAAPTGKIAAVAATAAAAAGGGVAVDQATSESRAPRARAHHAKAAFRRAHRPPDPVAARIVSAPAARTARFAPPASVSEPREQTAAAAPRSRPATGAALEPALAGPEQVAAAAEPADASRPAPSPAPVTTQQPSTPRATGGEFGLESP